MEQQSIQKQSIQKQTTLLGESLYLLRKVVVLGTVLLLCGTLVFGAGRNTDLGMVPAVKSGDLILYFRLDHRYGAGDLVALRSEGKFQTRRIVAAGGDTVDLTPDGLVINGMVQQEPEITEETLPYTEGIAFPVTLKQDEVFLLGDHRSDTRDSRLYGPVAAKKLLGKVAFLMRRRNL